MRTSFLPFAPPAIGEEEIAAVVAALRTGWISLGPGTRQFEDQFAAAVGAPGAAALNSCTAGLHAALMALEVGPGDEVITTPMTFAASVNVIEHVGARPVLVDVEPDTLNINPAAVEAALTPRTRVVMPVHYAGHPVAMDDLWTLVEGRDVAMVEDAAHAVGARYRDRAIGSGANLVAFSFYATKNLTTGEGGMLTGDPALLDRVRLLSLHGMSKDAWRRHERGGSWFYEVLAPGFKYNMTDLQAAMGMVQLRRLPTMQARRQAVADAYRAGLGDLDAIDLPSVREDVEHAWHLFVLRLQSERLTIGRDQFINELRDRNIGTSVHFIPIHLHPYYRDRYGWKPEDFPIAWRAYEGLVSLPIHPGLTDADIGDVVESVRSVCMTFGR